MPTCLECNKTMPRLQWTHFKYKCTGKFNNGKEYLEVYPDASLVDEEVSAKTAITLDNLINKYGEDEGKYRWQSYCDKQSHSNSFEYKQKKHGWSKERYAEFNKSRAVTISNLVDKHGEELGASKWLEYCERQAYTNTLEYFIEKLGHIAGTEKYNEICTQKISRNSTGNLSSSAEIDFIDNIEHLIGVPLEYTYKTEQFKITENNRRYYFDIKHGDCCVEFHGDFWHCNPIKYAADYYHPLVKKTAREIWDRNDHKQKVAERNNMRYLVVWEKDYTLNKDETLAQVVKWILNEQL